MDIASQFVKKSENVQEKINIANKEKEEGNKFFKMGDISKSLYHYNRSLLYVKGLHGLDEETTKIVNNILIACYNNLAAGHLKQEKYERVISSCTEVLKIDEKNVKALFRRGKAYLSLNDLILAEKDLEKASNLDKNDISIKKELNNLRKKEKEYEKKTKPFYENMFKKMSET